MAKPKILHLASVDNRVMDGLLFRRRVLQLFDQVRAQPDGLERLRLSKCPDDKKLSEELLPIARYPGSLFLRGTMKVRWLNGSQQHDAILYASRP